MGIIDISTEIEPTVFVSMNKILKYFLPLSLQLQEQDQCFI